MLFVPSHSVVSEACVDQISNPTEASAMISVTPVILSGGAGTRLWPLSTEKRPKQFHAIATEKTLFQEAVLRIESRGALTVTDPAIICAEPHLGFVLEELRAVGATPSAIVLEPFGRNTAAAAYIAALTVEAQNPDALVLLLPADHIIRDRTAFHKAIALAAPFAQTRLVTFGISASGPETGYGYIETGESLSDEVFTVSRFTEKPNSATAQAYLAQGNFFWNAGILLFSPKFLISEMRRLAPEIASHCDLAFSHGARNGDILKLASEPFSACPSVPVDIAVLEKSETTAVVPCDIGWADVGSWSEVWRLGSKDAQNNALTGRVGVVDSTNCLVVSDGPPVVVLGMKDVAVIATSEGVIVVPMSRVQEVRDALKALDQTPDTSKV